MLQYGNDLPIPIPDLQVDEYGVTATLSFSRSPQYTVVPWSAVYVVASDDGRGVLYHEDVPPDVSVTARAEGEPSPDEPPVAGPAAVQDAGMDNRPLTGEIPSVDVAARPTPTRALRAVPLGGPIEDDGNLVMMDEQGGQALPTRRRRRPQLRLVK